MTREEKEFIQSTLSSFKQLLIKVHNLPCDVKDGMGPNDDQLTTLYHNSIKAIKLIDDSMIYDE